jgi:hypothetical protein
MIYLVVFFPVSVLVNKDLFLRYNTAAMIFALNYSDDMTAVFYVFFSSKI